VSACVLCVCVVCVVYVCVMCVLCVWLVCVVCVCVVCGRDTTEVCDRHTQLFLRMTPPPSPPQTQEADNTCVSPPHTQEFRNPVCEGASHTGILEFHQPQHETTHKPLTLHFCLVLTVESPFLSHIHQIQLTVRFRVCED